MGSVITTHKEHEIDEKINDTRFVVTIESICLVLSGDDGSCLHLVPIDAVQRANREKSEIHIEILYLPE